MIALFTKQILSVVLVLITLSSARLQAETPLTALSPDGHRQFAYVS